MWNMVLPVRQVSSMYAQIVNGVPKEESQHVTDEESSAMWDTISGEVEAMKAEDPNIVFSIPNEMPEADDEPDESEDPPEEPEGDPEGEEPPEEPEPEEPDESAEDETPKPTEDEDDES